MKKAAGILVTSNGKCLLCKRNAYGSLPGEWSVPAGKIEKDEKAPLAAIREFYEETDLEIETPLSFVGVIKRYNREGSKQTGVLYLFQTDVDQEMYPDLDNAKDGDEHTECGYFSGDEIPSPMSDTFRNLISKFI
jgi:8-oxo-dGTP pyrophosphatase MutT (NUDIX family)